MRARRAGVALVLVAAAAATLLLGVDAATTTRYPTPSAASLSMITNASLPLQLSAGPDGATVSVTSTSSSATITAISGGLLDKTTNNTVLTNNNAATLQARLVFQSVTSAGSRCLTCKLQLRQGATTSDQVTITNGVAPAAGTAGPWVTIQPAGSVGSLWYVWADAKATLPAQNAVVSYWLEVAPNNAAASPKAEYRLMQMTFVV